MTLSTSGDDYALNGAARCTAHNRAGDRCSNPAMLGTNVCRMHGGAAPATQRKARLRLLELVDPAIATLARELTNSQARPADRLRAAELILDRAGYPKQTQITGEDARELLIQRLIQLRDQRQEQQQRAAEAAEAEQADRTVPGEVIEPEQEN